jgi:5-methylcytosine-specific restriction endonuclease McrA
VSYDCKHERRQLVWANESAYGDTYARRQLREQCLDCGWLLGEQKAHLLAGPTTPGVDKIALKNCVEARNRFIIERNEERQQSYMAQREAENAAWWARYDEHLASEKWQRTRKTIFERDQGICQGCLARPATQVHHVTYRNVCNEFAFQLVAICDECHERFHAEAAS